MGKPRIVASNRRTLTSAILERRLSAVERKGLNDERAGLGRAGSGHSLDSRVASRRGTGTLRGRARRTRGFRRSREALGQPDFRQPPQRTSRRPVERARRSPEQLRQSSLWLSGYRDWHAGIVGAPLWFGSTWWPVIYSAPPVIVEPSPPIYIEPGPPQYRYYCQDPAGYYPYVQQCHGRWVPVVPPRQSTSLESPAVRCDGFKLGSLAREECDFQQRRQASPRLSSHAVPLAIPPTAPLSFETVPATYSPQ